MIRANLKSGAAGLQTGEFIKYDQTDTLVTGGTLTNDLYAPNSPSSSVLLVHNIILINCRTWVDV